MTSDLSALFDNAKKVKLITVPEEKPVKQEITEEEKPTKQSKKKSKRGPEESEAETEKPENEDPAIVQASTVFVGNVPVDSTAKKLKKLFSQFGTVKSVRLRNLVPLHGKRGKRLAFIKKQLHPLQKTVTAFVRFSDPMEAQSATSLNGYVFKDHHLRVDMAHDPNGEIKHDNKRSIFIGNLPFDVNDDDVWKAFEGCGDIESVRLVRDRDTSVGKGFGYVLFRDEASVALSLRLNGNCEVGGRQIRIKTAVKKPKAPKAPAPSVSVPKRGGSKPITRKPMRKKEKKEVKEGRVEKRPAVKRKKELQKKKKLTTRTNNARKDVIQLKKES